MKNRSWALIIIVMVLVVTLGSCSMPDDPSVPAFVWNGFECNTFYVNGVEYIAIIGLTSDIFLEDNFVFPIEINGCEVRSIGRAKRPLLDGQSYNEYFNRSFDGVFYAKWKEKLQ